MEVFSERTRETERCGFDVNVIIRRPTKVAYIRHYGSYNDPEVQAAFEQLETWARARDLDERDFVGIPWDDAEITPNQKCRFDACIEIADDVWFGKGINCQTIPGKKYAGLLCDILNNHFELPWNLLLGHWWPASGFQPFDGPQFERYYSDGSQDPQGKWNIEVCLPVKPL